MSRLMVREQTTLEEIRASRPEKIYSGAVTCWWTHRREDLSTNKQGFPCDPRGGVLFETDDPEGFFSAAEKNPEFYGRHGLRAFIAAHHDNSFQQTVGNPWYERTLEPYNDAIDALDFAKRAFAEIP